MLFQVKPWFWLSNNEGHLICIHSICTKNFCDLLENNRHETPGRGYGNVYIQRYTESCNLDYIFRITIVFDQENKFENVACNMSAILFSPRCFKDFGPSEKNTPSKLYEHMNIIGYRLRVHVTQSRLRLFTLQWNDVDGEQIYLKSSLDLAWTLQTVTW